VTDLRPARVGRTRGLCCANNEVDRAGVALQQLRARRREEAGTPAGSVQRASRVKAGDEPLQVGPVRRLAEGEVPGLYSPVSIMGRVQMMTATQQLISPTSKPGSPPRTAISKWRPSSRLWTSVPSTTPPPMLREKLKASSDSVLLRGMLVLLHCDLRGSDDLKCAPVSAACREVVLGLVIWVKVKNPAYERR
jgi:hypothetical protein